MPCSAGVTQWLEEPMDLDDVDCGCASCATDPTISAGSNGRPVISRGHRALGPSPRGRLLSLAGAF